MKETLTVAGWWFVIIAVALVCLFLVTGVLCYLYYLNPWLPWVVVVGGLGWVGLHK